MGWYSADEHLHQMPDAALMLAEDLKPNRLAPAKLTIEELMDRLEAIRKVYEETYPPALAVELKRAAAAAMRWAGA